MIFVGNEGQVYGSPVELTTDAEVPAEHTLTIEDGQTLTVGEGVTLTNKETINVEPGGQLNGAVAGDGTLNRSSSETGVTKVLVDRIAGKIDGTAITVTLPYGTESLPTDPKQIKIILADTNAKISNLGTVNNGATWTFTVTAEDKINAQDYTIKVEIAPDPSAENKADVAAAKSAIEGCDWTVSQATANTEDAVKKWIENQLAGMVEDVDCTVSIADFTAATAGNSTDTDGTNGSFGFTIELSKGDGNARATGTANVNGIITATPYEEEPEEPEKPEDPEEPENPEEPEEPGEPEKPVEPEKPLLSPLNPAGPAAAVRPAGILRLQSGPIRPSLNSRLSAGRSR